MKKSVTLKVNGVNYQERKITCGKNCKTCQDGGHVVYYRYEPAKNGEKRGKWLYFGKHPPQQIGAEVITCQRRGCNQPIERLNQKYCSDSCRVAANRSRTSELKAVLRYVQHLEDIGYIAHVRDIQEAHATIMGVISRAMYGNWIDNANVLGKIKTVMPTKKQQNGFKFINSKKHKP